MIIITKCATDLLRQVNGRHEVALSPKEGAQVVRLIAAYQKLYNEQAGYIAVNAIYDHLRGVVVLSTDNHTYDHGLFLVANKHVCKEAIEGIVDAVEFPYSERLFNYLRRFVYTHKRGMFSVTYNIGTRTIVVASKNKPTSLMAQVVEAIKANVEELVLDPHKVSVAYLRVMVSNANVQHNTKYRVVTKGGTLKIVRPLVKQDDELM